MDLTLKDISEKTGLHPETARRLAQAGKLPGAVRTRRGWRMNEADLARFIEQGGARPQGRPVSKTEEQNG